jgi:hypothetical protein
MSYISFIDLSGYDLHHPRTVILPGGAQVIDAHLNPRNNTLHLVYVAPDDVQDSELHRIQVVGVPGDLPDGARFVCSLAYQGHMLYVFDTVRVVEG